MRGLDFNARRELLESSPRRARRKETAPRCLPFLAPDRSRGVSHVRPFREDLTRPEHLSRPEVVSPWNQNEARSLSPFAQTLPDHPTVGGGNLPWLSCKDATGRNPSDPWGRITSAGQP